MSMITHYLTLPPFCVLHDVFFMELGSPCISTSSITIYCCVPNPVLSQIPTLDIKYLVCSKHMTQFVMFHFQQFQTLRLTLPPLCRRSLPSFAHIPIESHCLGVVMAFESLYPLRMAII